MCLRMTKMSTGRVVCVMCVKIPSPPARNLLHIIHGESTQVLRTVAGADGAVSRSTTTSCGGAEEKLLLANLICYLLCVVPCHITITTASQSQPLTLCRVQRDQTFKC